MKKLNIFALIALIGGFLGCRLEPLPYPETFQTTVQPTGLALKDLVDGVELSNGDIIVVGTATKNNNADLFIARIDLNGKVVDSKTFDSVGNDEISAICKDDEDELYVVGRNTTKKKGLVFKISPKSNTFTQVWLKDDVTIPDCTTFKQVQFLNNLIYVMNGTREGEVGNCPSTRLFLIKKNKSDSCSRLLDRIGALVSVVGNGKVFFGGDNGGKSTLLLADCSNQKPIYSNMEYSATTYNHIRALVANADDLFIGGNYGTIPFKAFLTKISLRNIATTTTFSITNPINQIDSVSSPKNKRYYVFASMVTSPNGVVYAANLGYIGNDSSYTHLSQIGYNNINTSKLENGWKNKPFLNINTSKLLNSTFQNHGGYILIGKANEEGKVIKVNRVGEL